MTEGLVDKRVGLLTVGLVSVLFDFDQMARLDVAHG
jgi:hypothetical protein